MAAVVIDIADAVVAALNGASLGQSFTAVRYYVPVRDIRDLAALAVSVVPASVEGTLLDRSRRTLYEHVIDIGVQRVIGSGAMTNDEIKAAVDPLMQFTQDVADLFRAAPLAGYEAAECVRVEHRPIYSPQHADEMRVFTSVVALTFSVAR